MVNKFIIKFKKVLNFIRFIENEKIKSMIYCGKGNY